MPAILEETVLTMSEAARQLPRLGGKQPHPNTIWRWCRKGLRGVTLQYAKIGGRMVTSREALVRFSEALAAVDHEEDPRTVYMPRVRRPRLPKYRQREIERAEKYLREQGI